jgi:succinate dehydrogenase / fumarate reductase cytochrome b subunit
MALFYLGGVTLIAPHLYHGLWSARRSLGLLEPAAQAPRRGLSATVAILVWVGFAIIPLAIFFGLLR